MLYRWDGGRGTRVSVKRTRRRFLFVLLGLKYSPAAACCVRSVWRFGSDYAGILESKRLLIWWGIIRGITKPLPCADMTPATSINIGYVFWGTTLSTVIPSMSSKRPSFVTLRTKIPVKSPHHQTCLHGVGHQGYHTQEPLNGNQYIFYILVDLSRDKAEKTIKRVPASFISTRIACPLIRTIF